jgi:hypothetical protein
VFRKKAKSKACEAKIIAPNAQVEGAKGWTFPANHQKYGMPSQNDGTKRLPFGAGHCNYRIKGETYGKGQALPVEKK